MAISANLAAGGRSEERSAPVQTPLPPPPPVERPVPEPPPTEQPAVDQADNQRILPIWDMVLHSEDRRMALVEIAEAVEMGYLPVGLHTAPERPHMVLYGFNPGIPVTDVALQHFPDRTATPGQLAAFIDEGWLPMAIAAPEGVLTAIMIRTPIPFDSWGMAFTDISVAAMGEEIERRTTEGYSLWAIANDGERMWLFFVAELPNAPQRRTRLMVFPFVEDLYTPEIDRLVVDGWFPWGVTVTDDGEMLVAFTRTEDQEP